MKGKYCLKEWQLKHNIAWCARLTWGHILYGWMFFPLIITDVILMKTQRTRSYLSSFGSNTSLTSLTMVGMYLSAAPLSTKRKQKSVWFDCLLMHIFKVSWAKECVDLTHPFWGNSSCMLAITFKENVDFDILVFKRKGKISHKDAEERGHACTDTMIDRARWDHQIDSKMIKYERPVADYKAIPFNGNG